jgi:hypothetical protein
LRKLISVKLVLTERALQLLPSLCNSFVEIEGLLRERKRGGCHDQEAENCCGLEVAVWDFEACKLGPLWSYVRLAPRTIPLASAVSGAMRHVGHPLPIM